MQIETGRVFLKELGGTLDKWNYTESLNSYSHQGKEYFKTLGIKSVLKTGKLILEIQWMEVVGKFLVSRAKVYFIFYFCKYLGNIF